MSVVQFKIPLWVFRGRAVVDVAEDFQRAVARKNLISSPRIILKHQELSFQPPRHKCVRLNEGRIKLSPPEHNANLDALPVHHMFAAGVHREFRRCRAIRALDTSRLNLNRNLLRNAR